MNGRTFSPKSLQARVKSHNQKPPPPVLYSLLLCRSLPSDVHSSGLHERRWTYQFRKVTIHFSHRGLFSGHVELLRPSGWTKCSVVTAEVSQGHIFDWPIFSLLSWALSMSCPLRSLNRMTCSWRPLQWDRLLGARPLQLVHNISWRTTAKHSRLVHCRKTVTSHELVHRSGKSEKAFVSLPRNKTPNKLCCRGTQKAATVRKQCSSRGPTKQQSPNIRH